MSASWMGYFFDNADERLSGSLLLTALAIADHADSEGKCGVGFELLATKVRINKRQIRRLVNDLEQMGYLKIIRGRGRGNVSSFHLKKGTPTTPFKPVEKPEKGTPTTPFKPVEKSEKGTPTTPFSDQEKGTSSTIKGDKSRHPPTPPYKDNLLNPLDIYSETTSRAKDASPGTTSHDEHRPPCTIADRDRGRDPALPAAQPNEAALDPVERRIWRDGVDLLRISGTPEPQARSLLGKLAKEHGKLRLAEAIAGTQALNPADPKTYLIGVLKQQIKQRAWAEVGKNREDPITQVKFEIKCEHCRDVGFYDKYPDEPQMLHPDRLQPCPYCNKEN